MHGVEGWASGRSTGLASAVRTELYTLRHRLWALHLLGSERSFTAPLSLTDTGIAAALSALLARALRPRHHLGLGLPGPRVTGIQAGGARTSGSGSNRCSSRPGWWRPRGS
jgi:hypothetical protein